MIGTIVKLLVLVVVILVALKIFAPEMYDSTTDKISQTTGVEKSFIDKNIDKAKDMAIDGAEKLTDSAKDAIEDVKDKVDQ